MIQRLKPHKNFTERCLTPIHLPYSASRNHFISFLCIFHNFSKQIEINLNIYCRADTINMVLYLAFCDYQYILEIIPSPYGESFLIAFQAA